MRFRKLIMTGLVVTLAAGMAVPAFADAQEDLDAVTAQIDQMESEKKELLGEIDDMQAELVTTISEVEAVDASLQEIDKELKQTGRDLAAAQKEKNIQHDAMKARIQYIYEHGGEAGWATVFLNDGDISAWLNSEEYTQNMYKYDRDQLEDYARAVEKVTALQQQQQDQQAQLVKNKQSLSEGQAKLEKLLKKAKKSSKNYDKMLEEARAQAAEYQEIIDEQNRAIAEMVAMQQAAAAAAAAAAYQTYDAATQDSLYEAAQQLANQTGTDIDSAQQAVQQAYTLTGSDGTESGSALLDYATQFLGNRYVYGGNSLENGVDCSGFVQQVYAHFGINTSRTSWDIENDGVEVSYSDVQIGDIICYDGHVGIYAGNGQIINAQDEEHGITYTDADYHPIRTIRRML